MNDLRYFSRPPILAKIAKDRHAVIEASAGTGKTFTIEHLIVDILLTTECPLDELVVVTFTERATAELRARVRRILENARASQRTERSEHAWCIDDAARARLDSALQSFERSAISTIHGFCQRLLAEFAFENRQSFEQTIVSSRESFHAAFREELRSRIAVDPALRELLIETLRESTVESLESLLFSCHASRYIEHSKPSGSLDDRATRAFLPHIQERLSASKHENGALDFDDMIARVVAALSGPLGDALVNSIRKRYRVAIVDEFQDTDDQQWAIFRRIFAQNSDTGPSPLLYVIGDPKQAIYRFRGADVQTYLRAKRSLIDAGASLVCLEKNYRSSPAMIAGYNAILDQEAEPPFFGGEIRYDAPVESGSPALRAILADGSAAPAVEAIPRLFDGDDPPKVGDVRAAFAEAFAERIHALVYDPKSCLLFGEAGAEKPILPRDVFILYRSRADLPALTSALSERGIAYSLYKQEGLFQTVEARDIRDLIAALDDIASRSKRIKAWATPFFGVPWAALGELHELGTDHTLFFALLDLKEMADRGDYARLFARLSDAVRSVNSEHAENYRHIFELLIERAARSYLPVGVLLRQLDGLIAGSETPEAQENALRSTNAENAVQLMTIHKSKGLEATAVFVFGGFGREVSFGHVRVVHENDQRRTVLACDAERQKKLIQAAQREESERLFYVALTRARGFLALPFIVSRAPIRGDYNLINRRIAQIAQRIEGGEGQAVVIGRVARRDEQVAHVHAHAHAHVHAHDHGFAYLSLSERLRLARLHAPLMMTSYSALARSHRAAPVVEPRLDDEPGADEIVESTLAGRRFGVCVHELMERVAIGPIGDATSFEAWGSRAEVYILFAEVLRRFRIDLAHLRDIQRIVFAGYATPLLLPRCDEPVTLSQCEAVREMEFMFPIPESGNVALSNMWRVERGMVRGFIDVAFMRENKLFWLDWKTDTLDDYSREAVDAHAREHYLLQAKLYTLATMRMLKVFDEESYDSLFGGVVYAYLRGMVSDPERVNASSGVVAWRPTFSEMRSFERELERWRYEAPTQVAP